MAARCCSVARIKIARVQFSYLAGRGAGGKREGALCSSPLPKVLTVSEAPDG